MGIIASRGQKLYKRDGEKKKYIYIYYKQVRRMIVVKHGAL